MSEQFELPAELNIYRAVEVRDALVAWVTERNPQPREVLAISAAGVEEVDGAGLQLLASLSNRGHAWRLQGHSERFADACRTLGFGRWLEGRTIQATAGAQA
jgi:anti-anti-sigma regulatory factor